EWVESVFDHATSIFDMDTSSPPTRVGRRSAPVRAVDGESVVIERVEDELDPPIEPPSARPGRRGSRPSDLPLPPPSSSFAGGPPLRAAPNMPPGPNAGAALSGPPRPQVPGGPPLSGARTLPGLQKSQSQAPMRTLHVEAVDVIDEVSVQVEAP